MAAPVTIPRVEATQPVVVTPFTEFTWYVPITFKLLPTVTSPVPVVIG